MKAIPAKIRKVIQKEIRKFIAPIYFDNISAPIAFIFNACVLNGFTPIQEDNTLWEGFLCGEDGQTLIPLASNESQTVSNGVTFYNERVNNGLAIQWHKMASGRWELNAYLS